MIGALRLRTHAGIHDLVSEYAVHE